MGWLLPLRWHFLPLSLFPIAFGHALSIAVVDGEISPGWLRDYLLSPPLSLPFNIGDTDIG